MSDTRRTYIPEILSGEPPEPPGTPEVTYSEELNKIVRVRQFVVEMDLINCQNAYSRVLPQWLRHTEELDHADWVTSGVTVDPDTHVAPDGTTTGDTLTFSGDDDFIEQAGDGSVV